MTVCCVVGCSIRSEHRKDKNVTLHRFPKNAEIRKKWIRNIRRKNWEPSACSLVCSLHFEENCFDRSRKHVKLHEGSVPTKFPSHSPYYQNVHLDKDQQEKNRTDGFQKLKCSSAQSNRILPMQINSNGTKHRKVSNIYQLAQKPFQKTTPEATVTGKADLEIIEIQTTPEAIISGKTNSHITATGVANSTATTIQTTSQTTVSGKIISEAAKPFQKATPEATVIRKGDLEIIAIQTTPETISGKTNSHISATGVANSTATTIQTTPQTTVSGKIISEAAVIGKIPSEIRISKVGDSEDAANSTSKIIPEDTHSIISKLNKELLVAKALITKLKIVNHHLRCKIRKIYLRNHNYKRKLKSEKQLLREIFNEDQIECIQRRSKMPYNKWSSETKETALQLMLTCGIKGYENLLHLKLPYPSFSTLQRMRKQKEKPRPIVINLSQVIPQ